MSESLIAHHEAAHACLAILRGVPVRRCSIVPTRTTRGHMLPAIPTGAIEISDLIVMWLAGDAAERRVAGTAALSENDIAHASMLVAALAGAELDSPAVTASLARFQLLADAQVALHWSWIERVASALLRKGTLDGGDVADLM